VSVLPFILSTLALLLLTLAVKGHSMIDENMLCC